jgi:hypothetical protein
MAAPARRPLCGRVRPAAGNSFDRDQRLSPPTCPLRSALRSTLSSIFEPATFPNSDQLSRSRRLILVLRDLDLRSGQRYGGGEIHQYEERRTQIFFSSIEVDKCPGAAIARVEARTRHRLTASEAGIGNRSWSYKLLLPRACRSTFMSPLILVFAPVGGSV